MQFHFLHPADQIILIMERIYGYGMTTTSGGNLSILDDKGDIWITPAGVDKGSLKREDIICVQADGTIVGHHKPSSEFPFHQLLYRTRPDLRAVVHAHPPALVSFSIVRKIPHTHLLPNEYDICGEVGMAAYALPGSYELGEQIAAVLAKGINTVMLENHGVVVGGTDLFEAFKVFETLEYCARLEIEANRIGRPTLLSEGSLDLVRAQQDIHMPTFVPKAFSTQERALRRDMCKFIKRSYDQRLFTSTQGTFSQRLDGDAFLITPYGVDRKYLEVEDLVRIEGGEVQEGMIPSRSVSLHQSIYEMHPHVNSIIIAHPPHIMAFAVKDCLFDSRTIPESYILLRNIPKLPFASVYENLKETAAVFVENTPIVIVENNCVIVTGQNLLTAFDRLEVAEYSAKSVISSFSIGEIVHINDKSIKDIDSAFHLS
ncbi:L-fuculose-phosphate aldolase [Paenibacillus baekrokdamisoli]|uniref:L-fuculose-phosphate aldolase n=1 Tax=Paenibacillus baekrokdamisoli TaxID=1712516 RepID=A0A3G9J0X4_9BACL|nr:class II aldolase/adducin family protein [Paenibacillus baekrokdamisoli]MBB3072263.1 L-fuculose-phosphate aldolase [Paenibacillus baekrokdamisoli]BBH24847.1 L-fuculose-phosphate aldolase [Paenibacillus baekrokdamisoli]